MNATAGSLGSNDVPWYRQNWFGIACVLILPAALLFPLLTGDIYYRKDGALVPYPKGLKIGLIVWGALGALVFASQFVTGFVHGYRAAATHQQGSSDEQGSAAAESTPTGPSDQELADEIWSAYKNLPGNQDSAADELHFREVHVKGEILKKGTVLPRAMNSSVDERLPAYLACYDFIHVMTSNFGGADGKANLCIYYIKNPTTETDALSWRGRDNMYELESRMSNDGFVPLGGSNEPEHSAASPAAAAPAPRPDAALQSPPSPTPAAVAAPSPAPAAIPAPSATASASASTDAPASVQGSNAMMDGADVVRTFYQALGRGDGDHANALMALAKRAAPAYQPDAIEAFYGHMAEPLTLLSVEPSGPAEYEVHYRYRKQSALCDGHAVVTTESSEGRNLIARIRPLGNC